MLKFKDGISLKGLKSVILKCLDTCNAVFYKHGMDCTILSMTAIKPKGQSINLQSWQCYNVELIADKLKTALGGGYEIVIEENHIKVEYRGG